MHSFCVNDLSAFYLDVLKDRLYCSLSDSLERRSAQSTLWEILEVMVRLMAPVFSFTAEDIWQHLPFLEGRKESVFLTTFPKVKTHYQDEVLEKRWERLLLVRNDVLKALEIARRKKIIGHSLDAEVSIVAPKGYKQLLKDYLSELPTIFIVSQVRLEKELETFDLESEEIKGLKIAVNACNYLKCERCWQRQESVGKDKKYPQLCSRCIKVIKTLRHEF